jgi:copper chaperone
MFLCYFLSIQISNQISIPMKYQFKTNVKCGACVAAITPEMDKIAADWQVDLTHPDRILTVESDNKADKIIEAIERSGYKSEILK